LQVQNSLFIYLISVEQFGVVAEVGQKPSQFPQGTFGTVQLPREGARLEGFWFQDNELEREEGLLVVVEALFDLSHQGAATNRMISDMLVGGVSAYVNKTMVSRGEDLRFSARGVGGILKGLGIPTRRLGNLGRGFSFTSVVKRKIHELARQFGFDRRDLATLSELEAGYGGTPCALCESFGLTGGLRFADLERESQRHLLSSQRRPLFDETEMQ
jgi:hypothetical protein